MRIINQKIIHKNNKIVVKQVKLVHKPNKDIFNKVVADYFKYGTNLEDFYSILNEARKGTLSEDSNNNIGQY